MVSHSALGFTTLHQRGGLLLHLMKVAAEVKHVGVTDKPAGHELLADLDQQGIVLF